MDRAIVSRRAFVMGLGACLAAGAVASIGALPAIADAAPLKFRAIKVDVSPLPGKGLAPEAEWLAHDLPGLLRAAFAARLAPGDASAPTLVVRIDGVFLGMSGGGTGPFGDGAARDNIQGVGIVIGANGRQIASYPLFTTLLAFTGGPVHEQGTVRGRVAELANSFAYWLPGQMGS